jgi:hypothetical protein
MEEIKLAVFSMENNKSPGPNVLPAEFYKLNWDIIGVDVLLLFNDFYHGKLDIARFNYGLLSLLPKVKGADKLQAYRTICLLNVIFYIFTKVLNNRTSLVADKCVSLVQTAFIQRRYILDGMVLLHETLHENSYF